MNGHELIVALGPKLYRIERPFGSWPTNAGFVTDVTVDSNGHVFVMLRHDSKTQPDHPRIIELDPRGGYISAFGGTDIADAHLMTFDASDRLWVVDRDMHEIITFSRTGERLGGIGTRGGPLKPFNHPSDVSVSAWGDIYVSDGYAASLVHRFAADGRHLGSWGGLGPAQGQFGEPHSLWTFADGRVVVIDRIHNRVQVFDREGKFLTEWHDFYRPVGIWGDAAGNSYITDLTPNLHMMAPDGTRIGRCRPILNAAHGIYGAPNGDIYLAEGNPSRISKMVLIEG
jgi:peptidylglycine monooxygenase